MNRELGSVSVLVVGLVAVAAMIAFGLGSIGRVAVDGRHAQTAADAAALAAADELALGGDAADAQQAAQLLASANDATLERCSCDGSEAIVTVRVGQVARSARAVVDPCLLCATTS